MKSKKREVIVLNNKKFGNQRIYDENDRFIRKDTNACDTPKRINMNDRDLRRIYGKESLIKEDYNFNNSYVKCDVQYDAIIIISSYNRYDKLSYLINQIINDKNKYTYKIIILDDGSEPEYDLSSFKDIVVLKNECNYGKKLYWKSINKLLNECKKYTSHCIIQIDDDFILCNDFLNKCIDNFFRIKNIDNKYICIKFHITEETNRWGLSENWIDGGGIYDNKFIKFIDYAIPEISPNRWDNNELLSSGVWHKMSKLINKNGLMIYKLESSLAKHNGNDLSLMNNKLRSRNPINTKNFDE